MYKKSVIFLFAALFFIQRNSYAQDVIDDDAPDRDTTELEALPWFGNNQYLENFLDSIGYPGSGQNNRIIGADIVKFHIPIKFWIYRRSDGTGGPDMRDLRNYIDNLNRIYNVQNRTWIGFYMRCEVGIINDDRWFDIGGDGEAWNLIQNNKSRGCINIHIVGSYTNTNGILIRARFFGRDGIVLNFGTTATAANTSIAHEVGHYFELDHTHQYSTRGRCKKEAIDRNRTWPTFNFCFSRRNSDRICEATGDLLSDTPADPDLSNNNSCIFNVAGNYSNERDPWNDAYVSPPAGSQPPDTRNVMSYNRNRDCRVVFSRLQIAVMLYSIYRGKNTNNIAAWRDSRAEYDDYEMDNFPETARPVSFNEIQEHNFNMQYLGDNIWSQCDVDWVQFTPICSGSFLIETSEMLGRTKANTQVTLFDAAGTTQLAQNNDISTTNLFSSLSFNFVAGQTYLIRVENMSSNVTGYYRLQIGRMEIAGDFTPACSSKTLTINNLPSGSLVNWSASPSGLINFSCTNCSQTTITRAGDGTVTITANITACGITQTISQTLEVGVPLPPTITNLNFDRRCGTFMEAYSSNPAGATGYVWNLNFGQVVQDRDGYGSDYIYVNPLINSPQTGQSYYNYISVQAKNACGLSDPSATRQFTVGPVPSSCGSGETCETGCANCCPILLSVSPNPSTDNMRVETTNSSSFTKLRIIDKMGNVKKELTYPAGTKKATLRIGDLPSDLYRLQATDGKNWTTVSFSKQ